MAQRFLRSLEYTGLQQLVCLFLSEEKAKLLREMMAKIEDKNEVLE